MGQKEGENYTLGGYVLLQQWILRLSLYKVFGQLT